MCERCKPLEDENGKLTEEVSGLIITVRKQGREIGALKRQLTQMLENSPDAELTTRTLSYWKRILGKSDQTLIGLTGERAKRVRWAIRLGYGQDALNAMLDGLRLYPFVVYGKRRASGSDDSRRDDILHALKSEQSIEELIGLARRDIPKWSQMSMNGEGS